MQPHEIDHLINRAREVWLNSPDFDGRTPRISDSDVFLRDGRDVVELRDGEDVVAAFSIGANGELRFIPNF